MSVLKIEPYATNNTANFVFNGLTVTSNISSGNANLGNTVTANYYYGNGINLTGITATNSNFANYAGNITVSNQSNITSVGTLSGLTVSGTTSLTGNVSISGNLAVTGNTTYVNSNVSVIQDPVIELGGGANGTSLGGNDSMDRGTLLHYYTSTSVDAFMGWKSANNEFTFASNASVTNNVATINTLGNIRAGNAILGNSVTSNYFVGSGNNLSNIQASNITGTIANANYSAYVGNVVNASQSNITSVGTLNSVTANGVVNLTGASNVALGPVVNVHITGGTIGQYLQTDGSGILSWATISTSGSSISNGNSNLTIPSANGNVNISAVGVANVLVVTGTGANITGTANISGNANVGNIGATGVVATTLAGSLTTAAQPNVTSLGTLSNITVQGNAIIVGNLVVTGNTTYVNSNVTQIQDPVIELGSGANGNALNSNDSMDRGTLLHYYTSAPVDAFMGWKAANSEFTFASNASVTNNVATINSLGNIRAGNAILGNLVTANYTTAVLTTSAQPNITSVGTLTSLGVNGTVTAVAFTANTGVFTGNGNGLSSIVGANVTGTVANATYALSAGTVTTNAQSNITSVGTLTGLTVGNATANTVFGNGTINATGNANVGNLGFGTGQIIGTGNISTGNANLGNAVNANYFIGSGNNLSNIQGANVTGQVGNALVASTVYTNSQPNITSVGTLANLSATNANITGNTILANVTITGSLSANAITVTSIADGNSNVAVAPNANVTISVAGTANVLTVTSTGANIAGTLNTGTGNITAGNINAGNLLTANYSTAVLTTGAQPNITSIGTLGNLTVTNNVSANTLTTGSGSNANLTIDPDGTGNLIISNTTPVVMSNTLTSNGNIIFSGANVTLGPAGNVHISGGTTNQYLKTDGSGNLSWGTPSGGGGGGTSLTYTAASTPPGSANIADQWYNTSSNTLYEYISDGTSSYWVDIQTPTVSSTVSLTYLNRSYTGDGTTVNFTVTSGSTVNNVLVYVAGLAKMPTTDYTITGTTLTFVSAPIGSAVIMIRELPR